MNTTIAVIAIVAALALLGVVIVLAIVTIPLQEAEAGCEKGAAVSQAFNASQGRCFRP
ncbi:MAG TPA: hypothetical protein VKA33_03080 [Nitrososphaera sp.]|nr:hypothetical protein [Nitrososphaera sp.]